MTALGTVCVYAGSQAGAREAYRLAAERLATLLAGEGAAIVYGGGKVGLMGAVADAALGAGGHVTGIIPSALSDRELAHQGLPDLRVVGSMHERKALMAELSDAFVAVPGGIGTLEELVEVFTWSQLGLHAKPVALLNVEGFYDGLIDFLDHTVDEGFLRPRTRGMLVVGSDPAELVGLLRAWTPPAGVDPVLGLRDT
jgi:hypothetical protein